MVVVGDERHRKVRGRVVERVVEQIDGRGAKRPARPMAPRQHKTHAGCNSPMPRQDASGDTRELLSSSAGGLITCGWQHESRMQRRETCSS